MKADTHRPYTPSHRRTSLLAPLIALTLLFTSAAKPKPGEPEFFVRTVPQKTEVMHGDSTLVSIVVYTTGELQTLTAKDKDELAIKGCRVRKVSNDAQRHVTRARYEGRIYNALVWARYVVSCDELGTFTVPARTFQATVRVYQRAANPYDSFFGRRRYTDHKLKAESPKEKLSFIPKPRKTTEQLLHAKGSGGVL